MAVTVARRRQPLPVVELSTMATADHYYQQPQQSLSDIGQPVRHHHHQPVTVADFPDSYHVVTSTAALIYRDPTTAPLRKLSVDLIRTYKNINEVLCFKNIITPKFDLCMVN